MAQGKPPDGLLALYEAVCGEPARLSHALKPHDTWRKVFSRIIGKVEGKLLSLAAIAYGRGMSHQAFDRWAAAEIGRVASAYSRDLQVSQDLVGATWQHFSRLQAVSLPNDFRGKHKSPRLSLLPSGNALLREFDELVRRGQAVMRKANRLPAMLDAFADIAVAHEVLDRPGRFVPRRFAKEALGAKYACSVRTVANALREARKAHPSP